MRIGELAKLSGLTPSRIRFYEAAGVVTAVERTENGYRDYSRRAVRAGLLDLTATGRSKLASAHVGRPAPTMIISQEPVAVMELPFPVASLAVCVMTHAASAAAYACANGSDAT